MILSIHTYDNCYCNILEVRKVLSKIAKEKNCEDLNEWTKPCENHLHWSATSTFSGNGLVIWAKFKSFLMHTGTSRRHEHWGGSSNFDQVLGNILTNFQVLSLNNATFAKEKLNVWGGGGGGGLC